MKKRLLLAVLAVVSAASSFAYEVGEYAYTTTQRLKIDGPNLVQNGTFAEGTEGWQTAEAGASSIDASTWKVVDNEGPNGESLIESQGANAEKDLSNVWSGLEGGQTYLFSFQIKGTASGTTTVGTTIGNNYADLFLNSDGAMVRAESTDEAPVVGVATAFNITEEWQTVGFVFTPDEGQNLVMHFEKLATGVQLTNFSLHKVTVVYDDRVIVRKLAFVDKLLEDPNFNTEAAQDAKDNLVNGVYGFLKEALDTEALDDVSSAEGYVEELDNALSLYLDATTRRMNDQLAGTENVASLATVGRGANRPATYANLDLGGGNWGHESSADYLMSAIQNGYATNATYTVFNTYFPAGKYFFTAEIRNAYTGKTSWPCPEKTFTLATVCKVFVGKDSVETDTIVGEDYQRIYLIADVAEDGAFRAGVEWPGNSSGGAFFIKNVEVRAFGDGDKIVADIQHLKAWETYTTQWNAATSARKNLVDLMDNPNYPWDQQVVKDAWEKWDAYYFGQKAKGWTTEDGADAGVATTEELEDWAKYQGVEEYDVTVNEETGEETQTRKEYQVVRGYQNTTTAVKATNQVITDLATAIDQAKATRNLGANSSGDRDTYKTAIEKAINTITTLRATTTDATRAEDSVTFYNAQLELAAATEAFLATVTLKPFADIDFSKGVSQMSDEDGGLFYAEGNPGSIVFTAYSPAIDPETGEGINNTNFSLGRFENGETVYPEILRIGNGTATVTVPEESIPTDNSTFRATFDIFFGNLSGRNTYVELRNAAGSRVAGFSLNRYNGSLAFNEFNDVLTSGGTGMDVLAYATGVGSSSASNTAIAAENNRTSFDLTINYATGKLQGTIKNPQKGTCEGAELPIPEMDDNKIAYFVVGSNYSNNDRRSWFDNLKLYSFELAGGNLEEDITQSPWAEVSTGIASMTAAKVASNAIYNIMGVKVQGTPAKGLYIMNGKKYVIK